VTDLVTYILLGIPYGCVFALVGVSLVLTYKTSGVFNLAFGAQAFFGAVVYYRLHVDAGWPGVPALVATLAACTAVGLVLERLVFRYQRTAPPLARLVSALGLLVAGPEVVRILVLGAGRQTFGIRGIWWDDNALYRFGDWVLDGKQMAILVATSVSVVALGALFRWTTVGLRMRAVVESARMTELAGINADRVGAFAWGLSSCFAGLAGVLLAPYSATLNAQDFTTLLVAAIAAAAFGRLSSIPLTVVGGLGLGIAQQLLRGYLPQTSILAKNLQPALPFLALFVLLLALPALRRGRDVTDPLAGVAPPPPALAAAERHPAFTWGTRVLAVTVIGLVTAGVFTTFSSFWVSLLTEGVIYGVIFCSITVITGMAGQLSLCQATFAGIGGFATAQLVQAFDLPVLTAILAGAALAALVGALLAIPALRLGGIFLSLATLAFALMFDNVVVPLGWVSGGTVRLEVPRPVIGPIDFADDAWYFALCVVALAVVGALTILVRSGTTGRFLAAMRGSEVAAQAIGIDPARTKVTAFALSAGFAGFGGGLLVSRIGAAEPERFAYFWSLFFVAIVVSLGARTVEGAVNAGLGLVIAPQVLKWLGLVGGWEFVFFGLGAIMYARHPEGTLELQKRKAQAFFQRLLIERPQARRAARAAAAAAGPAGAAPVLEGTVEPPLETGATGR
jgi:ABC-type branched-subunit amino acid transport system permease subunit